MSQRAVLLSRLTTSQLMLKDQKISHLMSEINTVMHMDSGPQYMFFSAQSNE